MNPPWSRRRRGRAPGRLAVTLGAGVALAGLLAGCAEEPLVRMPTVESSAPPLPAYDATQDRPAGVAVLSLVPAGATEVAITDFDESRTELGLPDLTSGSRAEDRAAYWQRAAEETVLLSTGMLRGHDSLLLAEHGFGSDDVDWEAHWSGPRGQGWAIGFRPDMDMAQVQAAVDAGVGPLARATVHDRLRVVARGMAAPKDDSWATLPDVREIVTDTPSQSVHYRTGCVPVATVLGRDAGARTVRRMEATVARERLSTLERFSITYADGKATARVGLERDDVIDRTDLVADFPSTGPGGWDDAFAQGVNDPTTGRIGWDVEDPPLAARLTLGQVLPFAVCAGGGA